jgi:SWIM zinc finger
MSVAEPAVVEHICAYPFQSALSVVRGRPRLALAASSAPAAERLFFAGRLLKPEIAAQLLLATSEVALRRYFIPPAMVARILRAADPVVTVAGGRLRLESFSQCCGVYARADLLPEMLSAETFGKGTTNVDFNPPMRAALAQVRAGESLDLAVTPERVAVTSARGTAVEHKVRLPLRWLKGFAEVQALAAGLEHAATLKGPEARRFLSAVPAQVKARDRVWLLPVEGGLRVSQTAAGGAIASAGLGRLQAMKPLARHAQAMHVYASASGTSAFELEFGVARFMLVLSAAAARGFSGEGQLLTALGRPDVDAALARVRATLAWQSDLKSADLARHLKLPEAAVTAALALLAAEGLVGFDPRERSYFHRELPFDLSRIEDRQPRLAAARELKAAGAVTVKAVRDARIEATVRSEDVAHRVRLDGEDFHCTCLWYARTGGDSGPCKHVLAVMLNGSQRDVTA